MSASSSSLTNISTRFRNCPGRSARPGQKKTPDTGNFALAREEEVEKLIAAQLVGQLLQEAANRIDAAYQPKPGEVRKGRHSLVVQGIFGCFLLRRDYYYHPGKQQGHHPVAAWLRREIPPQPCEATVICIEADYTGLPMRPEELEGRKGKAPDGQAKTRMAALGCVFTQHKLDKEGRPLRDHQSTTYLAGFESPSDF
jgi:hypothetical protein